MNSLLLSCNNYIFNYQKPNFKPKKIKMETQDLKDYLMKNLTAHDYWALPNTLGITETKLSRLLNNTDKWDASTFKRLVTELKEFHPNDLLKRFVLKNNITVNEMEEIVKEYENQNN